MLMYEEKLCFHVLFSFFILQDRIGLWLPENPGIAIQKLSWSLSDSTGALSKNSLTLVFRVHTMPFD